MKKLLISLLTATMLTTGCTQAKEIGKVNNIENKVEEKIEEGETKEDIEEIRKDGIKFIDSFFKENISDYYDGYYADENGITIKFVDDGIVELLEADEELYEKFVELNMNICKQVSDILKADENYHVCITYTDRHEGEKVTVTNTFFVIVDGEIKTNLIGK